MTKHLKKEIFSFRTAILLLSILLIIPYSCSENTPITNENEVPTEAVLETTVIEISDGDTFGIYYKNQKWKVRVLYVDCFEIRKGDRLSDQARRAGISEDSALALGLKAKDFAKEVLLNKKVQLLRDFKEPNLDIYGRLLRITIVDGMRYDSLLKVNGLVAPEK